MKVIILCGGQGTRLREETEYKPKPMVEIGGKPILWHIMKLYSKYGINEFVLALGYKGDVIRNYFLNYYYYNNDFTINLGNMEKIEVYDGGNCERNWKVTLVETGQESMTGFRTKVCGKYISEDNFMLTYGDAVSNVDIDKLLKFHLKQNTIGTVTGVYPPSRFGDLVIKGNLVEKFKEKQIETYDKMPINGGFFVFKKKFLDIIPEDKNCDLERKPMDFLVKDKQLSIYKHKGFWHCMDTYRDSIELNEMWKKNHSWEIK